MVRMIDGMAALLRGEMPAPPAARLVGFALTSFAPGEAVLELPVTDAHMNPMGTVQGGVLAALTDAAMGWAYMTTLGEGESYTTLEMKINFLKPVRKGALSARARVRKGGRTVGLIECDVLDESGAPVAYAVSTCMMLTGERATGR
jgi:uncharacterized protein (TIGR00369 family)